MQIWKFTFEIAEVAMINMPAGSKIVSIQVQHGIPCIWAIVNPDMPVLEYKKLAIYGTGHEMDSRYNETFLATIQLNGLVWHIFER